MHRRSSDDAETYMRRMHSATTWFLRAAKSVTWDLVHLARRWTWAGHVARMQEYDPYRLSLRILHHRNRKWLDLQKLWTGSQNHHRRFHAWRWGHDIAKFCGTAEWEDIALNRDEWLRLRPLFVHWCATPRPYGPRPQTCEKIGTADDDSSSSSSSESSSGDSSSSSS